MERQARRSTTAEEILDISEKLIQTRGYSAFSYQDISERLGIRKSSIHHHFATKTALGLAVIDRYTSRFGEKLKEIAADEKKPAATMLDHYIKAYRGLAESDDAVCLCGALAGEMMALPEELRQRVAGFFREHQAWIEQILKRGIKRGEFEVNGSARQVAKLIFSTLQGGLLVKRATGDIAQFNELIAAVHAQLVERQKR